MAFNFIERADSQLVSNLRLDPDWQDVGRHKSQNFARPLLPCSLTLDFDSFFKINWLFQYYTSSMASIAKITGYIYLGCYVDNSNRILNGAVVSSTTFMTLAFCVNYCNTIAPTRFYPLLGLENALQCYCGSDFSQNPKKVDDGNCTKACTGDDMQICGDVWFISVYNATVPFPGYTPPMSLSTAASTSTAPSSRTSPAIIGVAVVSGILALALFGAIGYLLLDRKRRSNGRHLQGTASRSEESKPAAATLVSPSELYGMPEHRTQLG